MFVIITSVIIISFRVHKAILYSQIIISIIVTTKADVWRYRNRCGEIIIMKPSFERKQNVAISK